MYSSMPIIGVDSTIIDFNEVDSKTSKDISY